MIRRKLSPEGSLRQDPEGKFRKLDKSHGGDYLHGTSDNPSFGASEQGYIPIDEVADPGMGPEQAMIAAEEGFLERDPDKGLTDDEFFGKMRREAVDAERLEKDVLSGEYDEEAGKEAGKKDSKESRPVSGGTSVKVSGLGVRRMEESGLGYSKDEIGKDPQPPDRQYKGKQYEKHRGRIDKNVLGKAA